MNNISNQSHPIRVDESGHIHFVTTSCYGKKTFFSKLWTRQVVMDAIDKIRSKKGFFVLGYVLMPEHAHFLLASGQCQFISRAVGCLKWYASIQLLAALREKGMREKALWQPRYYDFNVFTKEKLLEKLNYCHLNPIRRGLVNSPGEWVHSSYRNYENNDDSVFRIDRWWDYWKI